jgi:sporulation protein YlmC with PRC-barrel domain
VTVRRATATPVPRDGHDGSEGVHDGSPLAVAEAIVRVPHPEPKGEAMRLELGSRVDCSDGTFGDLTDVVIDPTTRRVVDLVVEPRHEPWLARLVPIQLAYGGDAGRIALRATVGEVRRLPPVHEVSYLRLDGFLVDDPDWEIGTQDVFALPYYPKYDLEPQPEDYVLSYDRIPKHDVEIRRASAVYSSDRHHLGHVEGFVVDDADGITHLVLERGHLWERRDVTIPIGAVATVETDVVTLALTMDEVGALPEIPVRRWPTATQPDR